VSVDVVSVVEQGLRRVSVEQEPVSVAQEPVSVGEGLVVGSSILQ